MASSSSSSSTPTWKYDVFPSFSGEDVRKSFLSHLLHAFKRIAIISFIDNGIERSHLIADELLLAIRQSRISIVIFSNKYVSSTWCLNELAEIHDCHEESDQMVIPIFYEVDPSHVRKQTGEFGKAFDMTCKGKTEDHIERWKKALAKVAGLAGYDSQNWKDEAEAIELISTDVSNKLLLAPLDDFRDFVGMQAHVKTIMDSKLCLDSGEVRMIGIWGPSGIGKSTIATALFNRLSSTQFDHRAFLTYERDKKIADVRVKLTWAEEFLSKILCQTDIKINSLGVVEQRLKHRKVLVVLDNVDDLELLKTLVGKTEWFGFGSRIIVTTQDKEILKAHEIDLIYEVEFPSKDLALQMFCQSAFGQTSPPDGFMELAVEIVQLAGKLPLGLNVLGSSLKGKKDKEKCVDKEKWVDMMPRLRNGLNKNIDTTLRICYDGLSEEDDQDIFVYIACLFNGQSVHYIKNLLHDSLSVITSLDTLADKSLIRKIGPHHVVQMHILLQKLGRKIACEESITNPKPNPNPGEHRFLLNAKEISDVFEDNTGTNKVLGIHCNISEIDGPLSMNENSFKGMSNLRFLKIYKERSGPETGEVRLDLPEGLVFLPKKLRSLQWDEYPAECIPSTFKAEHLVELTMQRSKLKKLWERTQRLRSLRKMNLSYSRDLEEIPDLSDAKNLIKLVLNYCKSLVTLPSSIRGLNKLTWIWMHGCTKLEVLPTDVNLESLYLLDLRGCSKLRSFPPLSRNISILYLDGTSMEEENCLGIENLTRLHQLSWKNCPLRYLPPNFHPERLYQLLLEGSKLEKLWEGVKSVRNLGVMSLSGCKNLIELPDLSTAINLADLDLSQCESLKEIPDLSKALPLFKMKLSGCKSLKEIPNLSNARNLKELDMSRCTSLKLLPTNFKLGASTSLNLTGCSQLTSLDEDAQKFILDSAFKYAILPGKEVPTYFTHRIRGSSLTVPLPQSALSQRKFEFRACIVPGLVTGSLSPKMIIIHCKFRSVTGMFKVDSVTDFCEMDHMVVFYFAFCPQDEVDLSFQLDVMFEFEVRLDTNEPIPACKIKECGVRVLDDPSQDANDRSSETEYTDQPEESDEETERCKKRIRFRDKDALMMQMTGEPSQEQSERGKKALHVLEDVSLDPVITVREDAEIPTEDTTSSSQLVNYLRVQTVEDFLFTIAADDETADDEDNIS
ncbi:hypothetical protein AALP_AAs46524U000200 [Arabis alpina]|uniref:ADP-ribosyl cyclase/cyclic ADP-ribose hydrolase n=1 Tax=Arabis alpina TaxID=50452 RepID=A0A087FXY1_ARAAL|nr:hypothetical protein AALP_AAs46524U000200 [Arabis alpina]